jgi:hypothetical protein
MSDSRAEMTGAEAVRFASQHLKVISVDSNRWETVYLEEATGQEWILDYPDSGLQGGGPPRLRRRM